MTIVFRLSRFKKIKYAKHILINNLHFFISHVEKKISYIDQI